jgi:predicted TIM-barrel fold metal-dependent hydrolase
MGGSLRTIDCHQHLTAPAHGEDGEAVDRLDAERRSALMDELAISQAVVTPAYQYLAVSGDESIRAVNDALAEYVARNDFAVAGLGVIDPLSMDDPAAEMVRMVADLRLAGVSWHNHYQRVPVDDALIFDVIEAAPPSTRVFGFHCMPESWLEAPYRFERVVEAFPDRTFIAFASLVTQSQASAMIDLCRRRPNVYLETGAIAQLGLIIEEIVTKLGSERLLYGTDLYLKPVLFRHNYALDMINAARIGERDRHAILVANAERLFGLGAEPGGPPAADR